MAVGRPIKLTPNVARKSVSITATAGQTTFTPTGGYRINDLAVYRNGVRLVNGKDFTAVDGANVILQSSATLDDVLEFGIFDSFNIADAISANGNQSMGGDLTVGVSTLYSGSTGILSTNTLYAETIGDTRSTVYGDGSNLTGVANTDYIDAASLTVAGIATFNGVGNFDAEVTAAGGVDVTGGVKSAGIVSFTNTTDSTSSTTGAVIISGGVGIAKSLFVGNNVTVGGTVTYQDVTNVDSVGLITAQTGVRVTAGGIKVTAGVTTLGDDVLIGATSNSNTSLDQSLCIGSSSNSRPGVVIRGSSTNKGDISFCDNSGAEGDDGVSEGLVRYDHDGDHMDFHTADAERVRITSAGYVGINDTTGNSRLSIKGDSDTSDADCQIRIYDTDSTAGSQIPSLSFWGPSTEIGRIRGTDTTGMRFYTHDGSSLTEKVRIDADGDVGINTDTPRAKFDVRGSSTFGGGQIAEKMAVSASALNSSTDINLDEGMVHYRSANLGAATVKPNITSSVGINTALKIGESIAVTIITAVNSTSNYVNALTIDHADVTESWIGGSAPSAGGGSGYDIYAFNILKTANATYIVIGNHTMTSA